MEDPQTYDIAPPSWIKQLEQYEDTHYEGRSPSASASASASEAEVAEISPRSGEENDANGLRSPPKDKKGGGRKKKERKNCDSGNASGELQNASSLNPGTVQKAPEEGLAIQCEKYELMRRQYQALRHNYVHLRSRYQQLERRHGKCPLTKRSRKDAKSEETNTDIIVDDMLRGIADGVEEAVTDDECLQEDEGVSMKEGMKESRKRKSAAAGRKRSKVKAAEMQEEEEEEENLRTEMKKRGFSSVFMLM